MIGRASRQQSTVVVPFVRVALVQLGRHLEVGRLRVQIERNIFMHKAEPGIKLHLMLCRQFIQHSTVQYHNRVIATTVVV